MKRIKLLKLVGAALLLVAWAPASLSAQDESAAQEEAKLISVLQSEAKVFDKAKACQRLAVIGTQKAVPVLAGLLTDQRLAHYARFGLETIPSISVDETLRKAMGELKGSLLVGVVNSIGVRRDVKALEGLANLIDGPDADVAAAAAGAVGRIGTAKAAQILKKALKSAKGKLRASVADACLPCSESLLRQGLQKEAVALYRNVQRSKAPVHIRMAALRGQILARKDDGIPMLVKKIKGKNAAAFEVALAVSRELPGEAVTPALVAALEGLPVERKALVLQAIGDRKDPVALPTLLAAAKDGPVSIRVAALSALKGLGDVSAVAVLVESAAQGDDAVAQVARETLAGMQTRAVDQAIVEMLGSCEAKLRPVLIEQIGKRRIASAVPALRAAAAEADEPVRLAAIKALGGTIGFSDLPILTSRLLASKSAQETAAVEEALKTACQRMPDRDACAETLFAAMKEAPVEGKCLVLGVFTSLGGKKALEIVSSQAQDQDTKVRTAACRVLGDWPSEDAAHALLKLTKAAEAGDDRICALQAFRSLVRRLGFPKDQRLGVCKAAMELSRNDAERRLVLDTLAGIPAPETLEILMPFLSNPTLKDDASRAALTICDRIVRSKRDAVVKAMKQVMETTKNEEIAKRARKLYQQAGGKL